ncbi:MAG: HAD family hydrolase [Blastocatellia bacterium]
MASNQNTPRAVLWDVDGTLVDSLEYHWQSWREALSGEGYTLTREQFLSTFGRRNDEILRAYFGDDITPERITRISLDKEEAYREMVRSRGIEALPGVRRWLHQLKADGWRQAVASSAPPLNLEVILAALDVNDCFDAIVSAEEVERGKPDPQIFLAAAAKVQTPPARCIVVEDAPAGTEAARRAGMRAIGVLTTHAHLDADLVVRSLDELDTAAFASLLEG